MTQEAAAPTLREALEQRAFLVPMAPTTGWISDALTAIDDAHRAALAARPADPVEPTDAQIAAYLKTNDAYWHETDQELPTKPGQWRSGNVKEATRVSLRAALATPAEPSSRERWNAENPGELSLHTFDDDATPAEPSVRAALEGATSVHPAVPPSSSPGPAGSSPTGASTEYARGFNDGIRAAQSGSFEPATKGVS